MSSGALERWAKVPILLLLKRRRFQLTKEKDICTKEEKERENYIYIFIYLFQNNRKKKIKGGFTCIHHSVINGCEASQRKKEKEKGCGAHTVLSF